MNQILPESIRDLARQVATEIGVELYDLDFRGGVLRIFVESDAGVTVNTCARFSQLMSQRLDQSNLILERYRLDVSSPGLERKLRGIDDFRRYAGRRAKIITTHGAVEGTISRVEDGSVVIALQDHPGPAPETTIDIEDIRQANLKVTQQELFSSSREKAHASCLVEEKK